MFADCQTCHGVGAVTCPTCEGAGLVHVTPAHDAAREKNQKALASMEWTGKGLTPRKPLDFKSDGRKLLDMVEKGTLHDYGIEVDKPTEK